MTIVHYTTIAFTAFGVVLAVVLISAFSYAIFDMFRPHPPHVENEEDTIEFEDMK